MSFEQIASWIKGLSRSRPEFNDQPACPFASKSMWDLINRNSASAVILTLRQVSLPLGRVLIIKLLSEIPEIDQLLISENRLLASRDHIAMYSDPSQPIIVNGYQTTQAFARLIILQRLSELEAVRPWLSKKGYYSKWSPSDLARIGAQFYVK